jgi:hypothetical protein
MQASVLLVTLLGMAFVAAAFGFIVRNSGPRDDDFGRVSKRGYLIRRWMIGLCAAGVLVSAWSLIPFPLRASVGELPRIIEAGADGIEQWLVGHAWEISATPGVSIAGLRADTARPRPCSNRLKAVMHRWLSEVSLAS